MLRILVVDDEEGVRRSLRRQLAREFTVETACDGLEALDKIASFEPDAVLSDLGMPGMTGLELLDEVQRRRPGCVRFLLSGGGAEMEGVEQIAKPWDQDELRAKLREALARVFQRSTAPVLVGGLMTFPAIVLRSCYAIADAIAVMDGAGICHLPIVDGRGELAGIVSDGDLLRARPLHGAEEPVSLVMTRPVHTVEASTPAHAALRALLDHRIDALPVTSGNRVVGIVTVTDFLRWSRERLA